MRIPARSAPRSDAPTFIHPRRSNFCVSQLQRAAYNALDRTNAANVWPKISCKARSLRIPLVYGSLHDIAFGNRERDAPHCDERHSGRINESLQHLMSLRGRRFLQRRLLAVTDSEGWSNVCACTSRRTAAKSRTEAHACLGYRLMDFCCCFWGAILGSAILCRRCNCAARLASFA